MARDFDARRATDVEDDGIRERSLETLKVQRSGVAVDLGDDIDAIDAALDLPDADARDEELSLRVLPRQADEFTCARCFLVRHRSQLAEPVRAVCTDCV
jgi:hypothetical protein